jgi:GntR family transcriptional regulator
LSDEQSNVTGASPMTVHKVRPTHVQVEDALYSLLDRLQPGDKLPPEPVLAKEMGVSRSTLREVMRSFEERGFVIRKHGVGTFVAPKIPLLETGLEVLESIDSLASRKGMETHVTRLKVEERDVTEKEMAGLQLSEPTTVLRVSRTISIEEKPVAYLVDVVPTTYLTASELGEGFRGSVLDLFLERGVPSLAYARTDITAEGANSKIASLLDVRKGTALIKMESQLFSAEGEVVDYSISYFVPGQFQFHVIRRIPRRGIENGAAR